MEIDTKDFLKIHAAAGDTKLVDLKIEDGKILPVLIHQIQLHPISNQVLSVDFLAVDLNTAVRVHVPVLTVGTSNAVINKLGALLNPTQEVEIECLPANLPEKLEVDISSLKEIGNSVKVSDIITNDKVKILTPADQVVFTISELVQKEKVEEVTAPTEVEATAEKKPEEAAPAEGEKGTEKKEAVKPEK